MNWEKLPKIDKHEWRAQPETELFYRELDRRRAIAELGVMQAALNGSLEDCRKAAATVIAFNLIINLMGRSYEQGIDGSEEDDPGE